MAYAETMREFIRENYPEDAGKDPFYDSQDNRSAVSGKIGYREKNAKTTLSKASAGQVYGNHVVFAALKEGDTVLELGSRGGFDCFQARKKVGEAGYVIGVDKTPEMVELARKNAKRNGYANVEFRLGEIEHLPIADGSVDVIFSNGMLNLSAEKEQIFREAFRVLKTGGRFFMDDVVTTAELPGEMRLQLIMASGNAAGAEHSESLRTMLQNAGFKKIKMKPKDGGKELLETWLPEKNLEDYIATFVIEAKK